MLKGRIFWWETANHEETSQSVHEDCYRRLKIQVTDDIAQRHENLLGMGGCVKKNLVTLISIGGVCNNKDEDICCTVEGYANFYRDEDVDGRRLTFMEKQPFKYSIRK